MVDLLNIPKEELLRKLKEIKKKCWVHTNRSKNDGSVGNTLEDLLEIPENNLAIANTVDWELKAQRKKTGSLITLFHQDPKPRKPESVQATAVIATTIAGIKYQPRMLRKSNLVTPGAYLSRNSSKRNTTTLKMARSALNSAA